MHVGGLRTALYAYLFAQKNQGDLLLRIEDTDQSRAVPGAAENLQATLKKFGLKWQGKAIFQSQRLKIYQKYARALITAKKAYPCFCSPERLDQLRQAQAAKKIPSQYDQHCLNLPPAEVAEKLKNKIPHVVRLKVPAGGQTEFRDLVRGPVSFKNELIDDQVLLKSDGFPTYHLANVIDDHEMGITHVIRGEEWLPSTPKHVLLYQAFGWPIPQFAHLPLLLNPDKSKLSKRQGDVAVEDYLKKGYLTETLLNFILLLGWNPGTNQEIFNRQEMIASFDLTRVNKAGAVFDTKKLDWLNGHYLRQKSLTEFAKLCQPFFVQAGIKVKPQRLEKIVALEQARIKTLAEIVPATSFFFQMAPYETRLLLWKKMTPPEGLNNLRVLTKFLAELPAKKWLAKNLEIAIMDFIRHQKMGVGETLWPMRVALSGRQASPGPFEIAQALGQAETLKRIETAINKLEKT